MDAEHSAAQEVGEVWAGRYFLGSKVLDSKIIVYLRNFGEKSMALANSCFEKWIIEFGRSLKSKGKMAH